LRVMQQRKGCHWPLASEPGVWQHLGAERQESRKKTTTLLMPLFESSEVHFRSLLHSASDPFPKGPWSKDVVANLWCYWEVVEPLEGGV
jgi:hypothetical protein